MYGAVRPVELGKSRREVSIARRGEARLGPAACTGQEVAPQSSLALPPPQTHRHVKRVNCQDLAMQFAVT